MQRIESWRCKQAQVAALPAPVSPNRL